MCVLLFQTISHTVVCEREIQKGLVWPQLLADLHSILHPRCTQH